MPYPVAKVNRERAPFPASAPAAVHRLGLQEGDPAGGARPVSRKLAL